MKFASNNLGGRSRSGTRRGLSLHLCLLALWTPIITHGGITELDVVGASAVSGIMEEGAGAAERQRPAGNRQPTPGVANQSSGQADGSVIKCWQKGTLLLEEQGWSLLQSEGRRVAQAEFARQGKGDARMYWINLGETFCFMKTK